VKPLDLLSKDNLRELAEKNGKWCVSAFLPTHRSSRESQQDRILLKNLLDQAEGQLTAIGLRSPDIRDLLAPGRRLQEDAAQWVHQGDGLALLLAPGFVRTYRVPLKLRELLVVHDRFHLRPLLPLVNGDGKFYVLALAKNHPRLFQATHHSIQELESARLPAGLAEVMKYDVLEKEINIHTHHQSTQERGGKGEGIFHGHGAGGDDTAKRHLRDYFRKIDTGLHDLLRTEQAPLILAGVDYYFPIYREANTYNHLLRDGVEGSPSHENLQELHQKAWRVVEPVFQKKQQDALAAFRQAIGTGRASGDLNEILPAARDGRIATLMVPQDGQLWGKLDRQTFTAETHKSQQPGDEDLLDCAATHTLRNGGTVFVVVDKAQIPDGRPAAAIFRY
jgi:hypothetical protein